MTPVEATLAGTALVEASAGTGKTFTITTLFLRLVLEQGLAVPEIVVVTFTEAATAELRGRIRRRLREALALYDDPKRKADDALRAIVKRSPDGRARVVRALSELDLASISTIHAFCLRALQERAFESGARFGVELTPDTSELAREIAEDYWSSRMVPMPEDLYRLVAERSALESVRKIVEEVARRPADLPILPDAPALDLDRARRDLAKAYAAARKTWCAQKDDVCALLLESKTLKKNKEAGYIEPNVRAWAAELDALLEPAEARFSCCAGLESFSAATLAERTKANKAPPEHAFFRQAQALHDLCAGVRDALVVTLRRQLVDYVRAELAARKAARGVQGFEDLLFALDRALQGPGGDALARALRGQYRAALIDEFQDTDPVQFRIFRRVFNDGVTPLLFVGDPKQSIYAFRGADVFSYFQAAKDAAGAPYPLDTNHRSDPSLVRAVNTIFARAKKPFFHDDIAFHPVKANADEDRLAAPAFEILFLEREKGQKPHGKTALNKSVPGLVAAEIARFLGSGSAIAGKAVRAGDVAVLTRSNRQARDVQSALRRLGIPTVLESDASVFESDESAELEQVLSAILEPTRMAVLRSALATTIVGLSADQIVALEADESGWQAWSDRFRDLQDVWAARGFMQAYRRMLERFGTEPRLLRYVDGERRVTNLVHLGDLLHSAARRERLGPSGVVRWLAAMRGLEHPSGQLEGEASELRLESDARAVKLLTVHKSKGLEFPVVYCPFLWSGSREPKDEPIVLHDPADGHRLKLHLDPESAPTVKKLFAEEDRAEAQRLLYVALTRAKHRCVIVWGAINKADDSPLAYTLHPERKPVSTASDAELLADLQALVKASKSAIGVREVDLDSGEAPPRYVAEEEGGGELAARPYERKVDRWWRVGSFSALTANAGAIAPSGPEAEGRDRDEVDEPAAPEAEEAEEEKKAPESPVVLHPFPRGTKPGTLLHAVLEDHDFAARDALPELVREKLRAFGYADRGLEPVLVSGIDAMLDTPLPGVGARLRDVPRKKRVDELEFLLPVTQERGEQVTSKALAEVFAKHRTDVVPAAYVDQLAHLGFVPLRGYLRGFVDLVFEHEGRFWVVDYKSNHLGDVASAYAPERLAAAMSHSSYFLQYHLYTVAVHRWLARRMRGYDYERAFGGVLYLFARGMHPSHPPGTGIFVDRPKRELVLALSEVLDHG